MDWWASDMLDNLVSEDDIRVFLEVLGENRSAWPSGAPGLPPSEAEDGHAQFWIRCDWHERLRQCELTWTQAHRFARRYATSMPPPHNPWFKDLPLEWLPALLNQIETSIIEAQPADGEAPEGARPATSERRLRLRGGARNWTPKKMDELQPETLPSLDTVQLPGPKVELEAPIMVNELPEGWALHQHGLVKGAMMLLGLPHHHEGDDIVVTAGWEALLEGLGFSFDGEKPLRTKDARHVAAERIHALRQAKDVLNEERARKGHWKRSVRPFESLLKPVLANAVWALQKPTRWAEMPQPRSPTRVHATLLRTLQPNALRTSMLLRASWCWFVPSQTFDGNTVRPSASAAEWGVLRRQPRGS